MDNGASSYHRFINGDKSGLEEIIDMYGGSLMLFINGYVKSMDVAEDLMEDTFFELIIRKKRFTENASFKTYLFKIGKNKALNFLKKACNHKNVPIEAAYPETGSMSLEEAILKNERDRQLYGAMQKLTGDYSKILYLLYFEDMSHEESMVVMKKSKKQIYNLADRARRQLKIILEKEGFKDDDFSGTGRTHY